MLVRTSGQECKLGHAEGSDHLPARHVEIIDRLDVDNVGTLHYRH